MDKKLYNIPENSELNSEHNLPDNMRLNTPFKRRHTHKIFWSFLIISLGIVFLGFNYLYRGIVDSVSYDLPDWVTNQIAEKTEENTIAELKNNDTDQDGLTDYQEIYQYHTSMFLADTDSDSYSDYEEAVNGEDPMCPRGENCNLLRLITPQTKLSAVIEKVGLDPELTLQDAVLAELRRFLLENGVTQAELDQLTDEDLILLFEAVEASEIISEEDFSAETTPAQIRNFLLSQPEADATEINKLTDQELLEIRDKILE